MNAPPRRPPGGRKVPARATIAACLAAVAALAAGRTSDPSSPAPAAPAPPPPARPAPPIRTPLVESVSSELVLIETYATDGLGHPVRDLTRDDFILEVGGLRRPIASVEWHSAGDIGPGSAESAARGAAPGDAGEAAAAAAPEWPRRFVLFFDDNTSGASGLAEARRAAGRFLDAGLAPTDQVALAACEPPLRILHDFTTDRAALKESLARDLNAARRGTNFYTEMETQAETIDLRSPKTIQSFCELLEARWAGTLASVQAIATSLSGWRGYKSIIFMGDGVPEYPMDEIYKFLQAYALRRGDVAFFPTTCTLGDELKDLSRAASAGGVTLNTVETRGLIAGPRGGGTLLFSAVNSLRMLAETTGGVASTSNDFTAALQTIDRASRDYYVLGYVPEEPADGRYRHIVVRCRRKGVTLRFRKGFTRLPPEEARLRAIENAHLFPEMHAAAGLTLDAVDGPSDAERRTVDLVLHLPASRLLFQPGPEGGVARVTVGFVGIDAKQHEILRTARRAVLTIPARSASPIGGVNFFARVRLSAGAQAITAVARDETSGWLGAARLDLEADPEPHHPLLGLALYAPGEESLWLEVPPDSSDSAPEIPPSAATRGPASRTRFTAGESIVTAFRLAPGASPPSALRLEIRRAAEVVRSAPIPLDAGAGAGAPVKATLPTAGLATGGYRLVILEERDGASIERGAKSFRIDDADAPRPEGAGAAS